MGWPGPVLGPLLSVYQVEMLSSSAATSEAPVLCSYQRSCCSGCQPVTKESPCQPNATPSPTAGHSQACEFRNICLVINRQTRALVLLRKVRTGPTGMITSLLHPLPGAKSPTSPGPALAAGMLPS